MEEGDTEEEAAMGRRCRGARGEVAHLSLCQGITCPRLLFCPWTSQACESLGQVVPLAEAPQGGQGQDELVLACQGGTQPCSWYRAEATARAGGDLMAGACPA